MGPVWGGRRDSWHMRVVGVGMVVVVGASCLGHPVTAAAAMFSCHTSGGCCHDLLVDRGLGTVDAVNPMHWKKIVRLVYPGYLAAQKINTVYIGFCD